MVKVPCVILIGHESGRRKYIEVLKDRKVENIYCTFGLSLETTKNSIPLGSMKELMVINFN
jgi:hypothetical protein